MGMVRTGALKNKLLSRKTSPTSLQHRTLQTVNYFSLKTSQKDCLVVAIAITTAVATTTTASMVAVAAAKATTIIVVALPVAAGVL